MSDELIVGELIVGDCLDIMAGMPAESVDAIVTDPPYGLRFMGAAWDHGLPGVPYWAEALRVAKPGAWMLAFGGTRTYHRLACAVEDAGWRLTDTVCWVHAQGFPKGRAQLKPAWEPILVARAPGPLRDFDIEGCRIGTTKDIPASRPVNPNAKARGWGFGPVPVGTSGMDAESGRWPANVILTDPIDNAGTYSRFFLIPKARANRERIVDGERSPHPTQKPEALIRHLVKLVAVPDGLTLDPFLGSGTLGVVCDGLGYRWLGIERDESYAAWARRRIAAARPEWAAS